MGFDLPQYSITGPAPDYSFEPACGERTLQQTPSSIRPTTESTFIRKSGKTTVVLHNQEDKVRVPSYGRAALIAGSLLFDSSDGFCEVVLEIVGKIETMSSEGGAETTTVLDTKRVLWSNRYKSGQCPSQIEFSVQLPSTFRDGQEERPLPPTYAVDFLNIPALFVRSSYYMRMSITRNLARSVGFLTKTKRVFIPFKYYPRTRPHRPIVPFLCFFSAVKRTPEEWHQTIAPMKTPLNANLGPIFGHLLVPSARIYGVRDSIPFHVQLSGPEDALRAFLKPTEVSSGRKRSASKNILVNAPPVLPIIRRQPLYTGPVPSTLENPISEPLLFTTNSNLLPLWSDDATRPSLRVFLLRQVTLETRGRRRKSWRNQILGEAKLLNIPPLLAAGYSQDEIWKEDHLDWEGELRIDSKYDVGSWQAAGVHVKDFIALSFVPQNERTSPLSGIQLTVPVKLVTDTYSEGPNGYTAPFETQ